MKNNTTEDKLKKLYKELSRLANNEDSLLKRTFPFNIFSQKMPGKLGKLIKEIDRISLKPPYPWGQWFYHQIFVEKCSDLEGDVIEFGVALGGMSIFLAKLAKQYGKKVYSVDSFKGLPDLNQAHDNPYFKKGDYYGTNLYNQFLNNVRKFDVKNDIIPIKGFFRDIASRIPQKKFCFVHLDSDIYDSVLVSLEQIYDSVVDGGVIIIDDFFHHAQGPKRAASSFFNSRNIYPLYHVIFPYSTLIFKGTESAASVNYKRCIDGNKYSLKILKNDRFFIKTLNSQLEKYRNEDKALQEIFQESIANNEMLLNILTKSETKSSDIYLYWKSLEKYWDRISNDSREAIRSRSPKKIGLK